MKKTYFADFFIYRIYNQKAAQPLIIFQNKFYMTTKQYSNNHTNNNKINKKK